MSPLKKTPPYFSYKTLRNFLDSLGGTGIPTRIDRSVMVSKSGSNQVLLLSALKYLGLITDKGLPTADLQRLVTAEGNERQRVWRSVIAKAYAELFESNVDIERTTTQELSQAFSRQGVSSPDTLKKCVTFFSLAVRDAGLKLSPHVKPYAGKRRTVIHKASNTINLVRPVASRFNGTAFPEELLRKFPDFDPSWSEEERNHWLAAFERLTRLAHSAVNGSDAHEEVTETDEKTTRNTS